VDTAWRRSGREREGEGGGPDATVENGGVDATRIDVADRWAGTLRGPGRQWQDAAWGSVVRQSTRH
jgi:hypothetical protein